MMLSEGAIKKFASGLRGGVILTSDPLYEDARKVWNAMIDRKPRLIVRCQGTGDVVHAVNFARDHGLPLSVRGGGHSVAGNSVCEGGLMIDLSAMKRIQVDPVQLTARAQSGLKLGEFDRETQAFGLATTLGVASDTGIAGLTLGGGYGWLNGRYGLALDNVISVDVVTADGRVVPASATENEDLFWGVRGGGGNFGIVTSFDYRLHPVGPAVLGGMVLYPLSKGKEALHFFHKFSNTCPDEVSTLGVLLTAPDGNPAVAIAVCYCGPLDQGEKVLAPLRTFGPPMVDLIKPMRYVELQSFFDEAFRPGRHYYWKTSLIRDLNEGAIDTLLKYAQEMPTPLSMIYLQQLHGAASRVGPTETAFPHRYFNYDCGPLAAWEDPAETEKCIRWARECWQAMQPFYEHSVYVNALGDEGDLRVRQAFGPNYDRLVALKNKYDPTNLFCLNPNIRPTM